MNIEEFSVNKIKADILKVLKEKKLNDITSINILLNMIMDICLYKNLSQENFNLILEKTKNEYINYKNPSIIDLKNR